VIYNLVLNAIQAMPHGGTLNISAENIQVDAKSALPIPVGDYIKIAVTDHG